MGIATIFVRKPDFADQSTTVKASPTLFFPNGLHSVREVHILAMRGTVSRGFLLHYHHTKTLRRVLAMSRGLQTSTEIRPATIPETKLMSFWWGC